MATTTLLSTLVMGGLLLVVIALVLRLRRWQHPAPSGVETGVSAVQRQVNGPLGWSIAFFVATFAVLGLTIGYVSEGPVAGLEPATYGLAAAVVLGGVFTAAIVIAVYGAAKSRGLNNAQAAGVSATLFFSLFLVAIVVRLFLGG